MTLTPRDRRALILGVVALAVLVVARWFIVPWVDDWCGARDRIATLGITLNQRERAVGRILAQRGRLAGAYGPAINEPLQGVDEAQISLFQVALDVLAANGFGLTDYQPQRGRRLKEIPGVEYVPLQVRGTCKLPQLAKCLAALRGAKTLVFVDRVVVANTEKKPGNLEVTLVLATLAERKEGGP